MSWSFRKVGTDKAALAAAVMAESAPQEVKERVAAQVHAIELKPHQAIVVESSGHHEQPQPYPAWGSPTQEKTTVAVMPLIDTPLPAP